MYLSISQFDNHAQSLKVKHSGGPLDNQTWQTEWKTAPLAIVQLCEYKNQTMEAFVAASCLLSSGPPEWFTFSYCAWLWNWLLHIVLPSQWPSLAFSRNSLKGTRDDWTLSSNSSSTSSPTACAVLCTFVTKPENKKKVWAAAPYDVSTHHNVLRQ